MKEDRVSWNAVKLIEEDKMEGLFAEGRYMMLGDYCNSGPLGTKIIWSTAIISFDEELLFVELGERVAEEFVAEAIGSMTSLHDWMYERTDPYGKDHGYYCWEHEF